MSLFRDLCGMVQRLMWYASETYKPHSKLPPSLISESFVNWICNFLMSNTKKCRKWIMSFNFSFAC